MYVCRYVYIYINTSVVPVHIYAQTKWIWYIVYIYLYICRDIYVYIHIYMHVYLYMYPDYGHQDHCLSIQRCSQCWEMNSIDFTNGPLKTISFLANKPLVMWLEACSKPECGPPHFSQSNTPLVRRRPGHSTNWMETSGSLPVHSKM